MLKCPECGYLNLEDDRTCKCGLDLIDAFNEMPVEERQKLYIKVPHQEQANKGVQEVVIKNFKMPFWSMVGFMVKWSLASIPAIIILTVIVWLVTGLIMQTLETLSK